MTIKNYIICLLVGVLSISVGAMENDAQKKGNNKRDVEKFWLINMVAQDNLPEEKLVRFIEYTSNDEEIEKLGCLVREINLCKTPREDREFFVKQKHQWIARLVSGFGRNYSNWQRPSRQEINDRYLDSCYKYNDKDIDHWNVSVDGYQFSQKENASMMADIFFLNPQQKQGLTEALTAATVNASEMPGRELLRDYSDVSMSQMANFKFVDSPEDYFLANFSSAEFDRMNSVPEHIVSHIPLCANVKVTGDILQQELRHELIKGLPYVCGFFGAGGALWTAKVTGGSYSEIALSGVGCAAVLAASGGVGLLVDEAQYRLGWKEFPVTYRKKVLGEKVEKKQKLVSQVSPKIKMIKNDLRLSEWQNTIPNVDKWQRSISVTE